MANMSQSACCKPQHTAPLVIRTATEFIASLMAMFAIYTFSSMATAMYGINLLMVAIGTGIAYAAAIGIAAKISGGHLNPAITIASMLTGHTSYVAGICYIIAQILGAIAAASLFVFVLPQTKMVPDNSWFAPVVNGFESGSISANQLKSVNASFGVVTALVVEVIAVLVIVATAMAHTDEHGNAKCGYATHMGIAYAAGTFMTYQVTGAGLNPARSTGIAILAQSHKLATSPLGQLWAFWVAPIFTAALVGFVMLLTRLVTAPASQSHYAKAHAKTAVATMAAPEANGVNAGVNTDVNTYSDAGMNAGVNADPNANPAQSADAADNDSQLL